MRPITLAVVFCLMPGRLALAVDRARAVFDLERSVWILRPTPDENRLYPAGSLFKIVTACVALQDGVPPERVDVCDGRRCWLRGGHGALDMRQALALSCSSYFLRLSNRLAERRLREVAVRLGFDVPERLDPARDAAGDNPRIQIRPQDAVRLMAFLALGQGLKDAQIDARERLIVRAALSAAALRGTSSDLQLHVPSAAAKTGTALTRAGQIYGWCAGFAPQDAPRYAFAVVLPGASARRKAVPEAARLLRDLELRQP
jgi:cell division protein FtsI/penicillin-binding protein 2